MFRTLFRESVWRTQRMVPLGTPLRSTAASASSLEWRSVGELLDAYKKLAKAKLSAFVVFSSAAGFVLASKEEIDWVKLSATTVGTFGASASANALNQIYEREKDALMSRTRLRPLPLGRLSVPHAIAFAVLSGVAGVTLLSQHTNATATTFAAGNILLYAGIYTPLKQVTYLNTWVGAVVGAIPPLIGSIDYRFQQFLKLCVLGGLLHLFKEVTWNVGFCMMSRFDPNGKRLAACAFRNCIYLLPFGFLSTYLGMTSSWFSYESLFMTVAFALSASAFYQKPSKQLSRAMFRSSILFLPLYLLSMLFHRRPISQHLTWDHLSADLASLRQLRPRKAEFTQEEQIPYRVPLFAPFPFVPLPIAETPSEFLWEGLDDVILEVARKEGGSRL